MGSRSELLKTVETQQKQIDAYEKKLRDVIRAYKSLLSEKNALEASLHAIGDTSPSTSPSGPLETITEEPAKEEQEQTITGQDQAAASHNNQSPSAHSSQQKDERVTTLKKALKTITQEKSRIEAALTEDKKRVLVEQETLKQQLVKQREDAEKSRKVLEQQLNEVRATLRQNQCERECEQSDHAAMLKELQQKMAQQRVQNEHLNKELKAIRKQLQDKSNEPFEYQDRIAQLNQELNRTKALLQENEKRVKETPHLFQLQKEMADLKLQHQSALEQEQRRALQSESHLNSVSHQSEQRVNALEMKISELSAMLGEYERSKQQDLGQIEKYKARVAQLDQENSALTKAAASAQNVCSDEDTWKDVVEKIKNLSEQLRKLPAPLHVAPANLYEMLGLESPDGENAHRRCRQEYDGLRDEYEKYKLKAQAVLKTKSLQQKDGSGESDRVTTEHLRSVIASLQTKLQDTEGELRSRESRDQDSINGLRHTIAEMQTSHERALADFRQSCAQKINDAESEMHKQRERTLEVLAEKEQELETMRTILATVRGQGQTPSVPTDPKVQTENLPSPNGSGARSQHSPDSIRSTGGVSWADPPSSQNGGATSEFPPGSSGPNVYYSQELALKEKDIVAARRQIHALESAMRDIQASSVSKELRHYETVEKLKEEIQIVEGKLRLYSEDANLEYLRNVLVKYILCDQLEGKQHMLKAIGLVLKLSPKELDLIQKHNYHWWWWSKGTTT